MHTETVLVYFDDLDAMGVVHNAKYVTLLERALAGYWTRAGWPYDPGQPRFAEILFAVRESAITYHLPIARAGPVQVRFWPPGSGGARRCRCGRCRAAGHRPR